MTKDKTLLIANVKEYCMQLHTSNIFYLWPLYNICLVLQ